MGIAGMVLGIIAIVFVWIPLIGPFIAIPCIAVGLPLSGVAIYQGKQRGTGIGMAVAGLVTCLVALVIIIIAIVIVGALIAAISGTS